MKNLVLRLSLSCLIIIITAISYAGNYLPILTWPGTGTYKSDGLDPEVGIEGTTFTFRVKYIDYDNEAPPGDVMVVLNTTNGEIEFPMSLEGTNRDYRKGVIYKYATTTLTAFSYSYYFKVTDDQQNGMMIAIADRSGANGEAEEGLPEADQFPIANKSGPAVVSEQILGWVGSDNYANDGLHPENGGTNTVFTYKVKCFGTSSPPIGYPMVTIMDSGGIVATRTMKPETGGTPLDGKMYSTTNTFSAAAQTGYTYAIKIAEESADVTGNGPDIYPNNSGVSAFLDWTGESGYEDDVVEPDIVSYGSTFTYRIKYVDVEGRSPDRISITINGSESPMNLISGTSATGAIYQYQGIYPSPENGTITGSVVVITNGTQLDKPVNFYAVNIPPLLIWTGESGYKDDGVEPNVGTAGTVFTFHIKYTDPEGNIPQGVALKIKDAPALQMTLVDNGIYEGTGTFSLGEHEYWFYALDSMSAIAGGSETVVGVSAISNVPAQLATFTVSIGTLKSVCITGIDTVGINESATFTAHAFNEFNGEIGDSDVVYSWEIVEGVGSIINGKGSKTVTFQAGTSTDMVMLNVTVSPNTNGDLQGTDTTATKTITIKPGKPQALFFSETGTNTIVVILPVGSSTGFAVSGRDSSGNTVTVTGCNWTVEGGIGSLDTSQGSQVVFTAGTTTGTGSVLISTLGSNGTLTATASITITSGGFHHFDILPGSSTVKVDGSITVTLLPRDINGNIFAGVVQETTIQIAVGTVTVNLGTCAVNTAVEFSWPVGLKNTLGTGFVYALIDNKRVGTSSPFSVVSGSPHHFKITSPATNTAVQAGGSLTIAAQLQDRYNNLLALGTASQVVFSSDSFGTFSFGATSTTSSGTIAIQTGANGQAAGTYQPNCLAGSKAIFVGVFLASDNTVCGTSGAIILTVPAAPTGIIVTTPAIFTAGVPGTISIVARDSYNNPATATLTFVGSSPDTITPTGCVIIGVVGDGFVWQDGGTWTGTVSFTKAQSQAILNVTAQNGKIATATFNILPAEPAFMNTAIIPAAVAVVNSSVELRVGLSDRWGNPVATTTINWEPQGLAATTTQTINGTATLAFTLGTKTGEYVVRASSGTLTVTFTITAILGTPTLSQNFTIGYGTVNKQVNLEAYLRDGAGNPCSGTVTWKLIEPLLAAASLSATATGINIQTGSASITLTLGTRSGAYVVRASVETLTATFTITATPDEPAAINTAGTSGIMAMVGSQVVLSVGLTDKYGNQAATTTVNWQLQGIATTTQTMNGTTSLGFTLGTRSGVYVIKARIGVLDTTFTIIATPDVLYTMNTTITPQAMAAVNSSVELSVILADRWGNPVATTTVNWEPQGLFATTTQTINGTASLIFTLGTKTGEYIVKASCDGRIASFTITAIHAALSLSPVGSGQIIGRVGDSYPLEIKVGDEYGNSATATISWELILTPATATLSATNTITDESGKAMTTITLGDKSGTYTVKAKADGLNDVVFQIMANAGTPTASNTTWVGLPPATATANGTVTVVVTIRDGYGNVVNDGKVDWIVIRGTNPVATITTNIIDGKAKFDCKLGTIAGTYTVDAKFGAILLKSFSVHVNPGVPILFQNFTAKTCSPGADIPLEIGCRDAFGNVVNGTVTWEIMQMPATASWSVITTIINPQTGSSTATLTVGSLTGAYVVRAKVGTLTASFTITAWTEESASDELLIYPNPVKVQEWDKIIYPEGPWVKFGRFDKQVTIRIYDVSGSLIRIMENVTPSSQNFVQWDMKNDDGLEVNSGIYLCVTTANGKKMMGRFAVFK